MLVAVGDEDDGARAGFAFERVGVDACLVESVGGGAAGSFRFDEGEGFAVFAPEHVVDAAVAAGTCGRR